MSECLGGNGVTGLLLETRRPRRVQSRSPANCSRGACPACLAGVSGRRREQRRRADPGIKQTGLIAVTREAWVGLGQAAFAWTKRTSRLDSIDSARRLSVEKVEACRGRWVPHGTVSSKCEARLIIRWTTETRT